MPVNVAIVGPAGAGKTTLFNALTSGRGADGVGMVDIPDERLTRLAEAVRAKDWEQANRLALAILGDAVTEAKPNGGTGKAKVNATVINNKAAEDVMTRIAKSESVDEKALTQYEEWLSAKGDTERANALRRELGEWKSARAVSTIPVPEQHAMA